ncbi:MAG TPA: S9 family peptidase [Candidatus Limnocylindrales bacterium]
MSRRPRPEDLLAFRIASEVRLSPDGRLAVFTLQAATRRADGYRRAIWAVPTDGSAAPRQLTLGARNDRHPRFSPDGGTLAFLSDRQALVEDDAAGVSGDGPGDGGWLQIHLLPLDGGEARRLTDLPRGVEDFAWSPDSSRIVAVSSARGGTVAADRRARRLDAPADRSSPLTSDYRYTDRLGYLYNGKGWINERIGHLWLVDAATGEARQLTDERASDGDPAWSPDGRSIAFTSNRDRDHDLIALRDIHLVDVATKAVRPITGGTMADFFAPAFLPDGRTIAALGHRWPANAGSRNDIWLLAADGSDATPTGGRDLSAAHDLMPGSSMNSDLTIGEDARIAPSDDGRWITFSAPIEGSYELWRIATGDGRLERLTEDRHYISCWDRPGGSGATAYLRSSATELPDVWVLEGRRGAIPRRLGHLNEEALAGVVLSEPEARWIDSDGRRVQGWYMPPAALEGATARTGPAPLVVEIHGGPHTLYGWSPVWEFQVLAGAGMGVWYSNPRGSEGYGQDFNAANFRDWGDGPMRDVLAGVDALVANGLADPDRLGVTGGSYGGYLTNWIVAKDRRFRAALTARSVADLWMLMMTGDVSGGEFGRLEFGVPPWKDEALYRSLSPITYAAGIRTPLLIQHAERDIRTTVGQAESLFTFLRSHRRPVRLMRVPEETHELTRSGTPFRRVENLVQVRDWFAHFLVRGRRRLPPIPKRRGAS